jgi:hypothetical protein
MTKKKTTGKKTAVKKAPVKKKKPVIKKPAAKKKAVKKKPIKRGLAGRSSDSIKRDLIECLEKALGVVTTACKMAKVSRKTFYQYTKNDEEFAEAVADIQEIALDFGESALYKQISKGNHVSTIYFLKTKGRARGFNENVEINQTTRTSGHITTNKEPMDLETWEKLGEESLKNQDAALQVILDAKGISNAK